MTLQPGPQQQPHQPAQQPAWSPPRTGWPTWSGKKRGIIAAIVILLGTGAWLGYQAYESANPSFDAKVTTCWADGRAAKVGFTITNTTNSTRDATVRIEYRDADGSRLDTDTSFVRDLAGGDTVRTEETTDLDTLPTGAMTCQITGVS